MSSIQSLYRVLEYLITKAALTGKLQGTKVRIPFIDLAKSVGSDKTEPVDLIVKVDFEWVEHEEDKEVELEEEQDEYEDGSGNGYDSGYEES